MDILSAFYLKREESKTIGTIGPEFFFVCLKTISRESGNVFSLKR